MSLSRVILHADANCFYASVECLRRPMLRRKPVAVCGDPEARHGIVLTANYAAKRAGVRVGQAIWQARRHCPQLIAIAPDFPLYIHFSQMMRAIWEEYSDRVEAFGLDESWIDLSHSSMTLEQGKAVADTLRERVRRELGISVSVGVANNKVFAKLGSDLKKPDGTTVIHPETFREKIWPLPAWQLLYVGPATTRKLRILGIQTIGDLAQADAGMLKSVLGKNGLLLRAFAQGLDASPVMPAAAEPALQSIGNSTTTPHDIATPEDAKCVYYLLAESVAARMREHGLKGQCVSVSIRTAGLDCASCQAQLPFPTALTDTLAQTAYQLFSAQFLHRLPLRSVGLSCAQLSPANAPVQLAFGENPQAQIKKERLDQAIDDLRRRYGHNILQRGVVLADQAFAALNPKEDNTIHPVPFFRG